MSGDSAIWALGLMSGTSMDGVDAALIRTDGEGIAEFGPTLFQPYGDEERSVLRAALKDARGMAARDERFGRPRRDDLCFVVLTNDIAAPPT